MNLSEGQIHKMLKFGRCPNPPEGSFEVRRYCETKDLKYLENPDGELWSKDEPASSSESTEQNVSCIYDLAGVPKPDRFASLALVIAATPRAHGVLQLFGAHLLILRPETTLKDLFVLNGDVKNLGKYLQDGADRSQIKIWRGESLSLNELGTCAGMKSMTPAGPRLHGQYFEGRLLRAIRPTDIAKIYIQYSDDSEGVAVARRILDRNEV